MFRSTDQAVSGKEHPHLALLLSDWDMKQFKPQDDSIELNIIDKGSMLLLFLCLRLKFGGGG